MGRKRRESMKGKRGNGRSGVQEETKKEAGVRGWGRWEKEARAVYRGRCKEKKGQKGKVGT